MDSQQIVEGLRDRISAAADCVGAEQRNVAFYRSLQKKNPAPERQRWASEMIQLSKTRIAILEDVITSLNNS
jgi:hypothetical protein